MGPLEMFGMYPQRFRLTLVSEAGGTIASAQGPRVVTERCSQEQRFDIVLVPGGEGTRREIDNATLLQWLADQARTCRMMTSVCTGAVLLARAGLLDGRRATTNKRAFDWVAAHGPRVQWVRKARWVEDGRFWTASGVSAGMDMALAMIGALLGPEAAEEAALWAEYDWHRDAEWDPFAMAGIED
jgi:transcriptional regulator GlxA family with amidase domain